MAIVSPPDASLREAFWDMLDDYAAHDPAEGEYFYAARPDFAAYVRSLLDEEQGLNLRPGWVPCTHRWLLDEAPSIIGLVRVRHNILPPFLAEEGGHIGYDVPPSRRGHGYAVLCLQAGLEVARALGLPRVLLCADRDNPASWKTIEKCGGVLEREFYSNYFKTLVRRYWIDLTPPLSYREIAEADVPALSVVRASTHENRLSLAELEALGITVEAVRAKLLGTYRGWLCEVGGTVVGFAIGDRATGELWVIAALPDYVGRGIGHRLLTLVEDWLAAEGCARFWLTTDVDPALKAYRFYRQHGWTDDHLEGGLRYMVKQAPPRGGG